MRKYNYFIIIKWTLTVFFICLLSCSSESENFDEQSLYQTWWSGQFRNSEGSGFNIDIFFENKEVGEATLISETNSNKTYEVSFKYNIKDKILFINVTQGGFLHGNWLIQTMKKKSIVLERIEGPNSTNIYLKRKA